MKKRRSAQIDFLSDIPYNARTVKSKIDIPYICSLARLRLTEEEKSRLSPQLARIIRWVNTLKELEIDESGGEALSPHAPFPLPFRMDELLPSLLPDEVLASSPEKEGAFIIVPRVIEDK